MRLEQLNPFYIIKNRKNIPDLLKYQYQYQKQKYIPFCHKHEIPLTKNEFKIKALKNKHKGKRAFIIGNGPSLKIEDLDKLKNEITFASNKIYLAFDQTDWRPVYYSVIDIMVAQNNSEKIKNLKLPNQIFTKQLFSYFDSNNIYITNKQNSNNQEYGFSQNLLEGSLPGYTVLFFQMQLAYYMGIQEIYLIGTDFSFSISKQINEKSINGEILLEQENENNHFHPDYRQPGEKWTYPKLEEQKQAFKAANDFFNSKRYKIKNASRKTKLKVFPLVNFDDLFI